MEITRIGYQKALNSYLPRKYAFVERVDITRGPGIKMGMFICDLHLTTKEGFYKRMKDECKEKYKVNDVIGFWPFIQCFGKNYDIIGFEKDVQMIYTELTGFKSISRDITIKFELR